jgi:hypothetical protein
MSEQLLFSFLLKKLPCSTFVILSFLSHFIYFSVFSLAVFYLFVSLPSFSLNQHPGEGAAESLPAIKIRKKKEGIRPAENCT